MEKGLILFDGYCNFCSRSVNFILDRDTAGYFQFTSLQSEAGQSFLKSHGLKHDDFDSFVVYDDGKVYTHSSAALQIAYRLRGAWKVLYALKIVPRPIRDFFYRLFAKNRYRLFGKREQCRVPTAEERSRFI